MPPRDGYDENSCGETSQQSGKWIKMTKENNGRNIQDLLSKRNAEDQSAGGRLRQPAGRGRDQISHAMPGRDRLEPGKEGGVQKRTRAVIKCHLLSVEYSELQILL